MRLPLLVYLDNSDLSDLFKSRTDDHRHLLSKLRGYADRGEVAYPYSFWHVLEFIQDPGDAYVDEHRRKASFLKNLCGNHPLPFHSDVADDRSSHSRLIWFPLDLTTKWSLDMQAAFRKKIDDRPDTNRKLRRAAKSPKTLRGLLRRSGPIELQLQKTEPITDTFVSKRPFTKLLLGEISEREAILIFGEMMCDPEFFFEKWFVDQAKGSTLRNIAEQLGKNTFAKLEAMRVAYRDMLEKRRQLVRIQRNIRRQHAKLRELGIETVQHLEPLPPAEFPFFEQPVDYRFRYLRCYLKHAVTQGPDRSGDLGDLMHLFYTEDVDLMRCDIRMYRIFASCPFIDHSKLVPSIWDLPSRIDALLARVDRQSDS